uniref:TLC domain-containing protein n=1 Tax=Parastrongyloides trichosuri TaxID=131310 RepID=A0A0N4ZJ66_PARTI
MLNIWSEEFWFPNGVTWDTLKSNETFHYPQISEFKYSIYVGIFLTLIRIITESYVFLPIGYYMGFIKLDKEVTLLSKCYTHLRGGFAGRSKFKKVAETAWRFVYFVFAVGLGYWALYDSDHLYEIENCWVDWPYQNVNNKVMIYYMIEIGFYWALIFSHFSFDLKKSDYWQMLAHHGITILLLFISFSINFMRIGTLILLSHDFTDIFIEFCKLIRYAGWDNVLNFSTLIFIIVWIGTRLIYYPFWIIYSVIYTAPQLIEKTYSWFDITSRPIVPRILLGMLIGLLCLHIFWTWLLAKIVLRALAGNKLDDAREDSDEDDDSTDEKKGDSKKQN